MATKLVKYSTHSELTTAHTNTAQTKRNHQNIIRHDTDTPKAKGMDPHVDDQRVAKSRLCFGVCAAWCLVLRAAMPVRSCDRDRAAIGAA